ncbi:hypothetical protein ABPG75_012387 [Micractinium tetrahymenae]
MLSDLTFWDGELEAAMEAQLRTEHGPAAARFAAFRCLLLLGVALRACLSGAWVPGDLLFLAGAASNALPALAVWPRLPPRLIWCAWDCSLSESPAQPAGPMQCGAILCDVLQAAIGCANHTRMAPAHPGIGPLASLAYLPFGSTALWLPCYAAFSALPFHLELVKTGLVTTVLLASSPSMCAASVGLPLGYSTLHAALRAVWRRLGAAAASIVTLPAALDAATCGPLAAQEQGMTGADRSIVGDAIGEAARPAASAVCVQYQTLLLLTVFLATAWAVHRTQRRMRTRFLLCTAAAAGSSGPAASLSAAAAAELVGPQPDSSLDFLCLGVPAALCVLFAVSLSW